MGRTNFMSDNNIPNADQPAHPFIRNEDFVEGYYGLTKREHIAAMAMQGIIQNDKLVQTCLDYATVRKTTPEKIIANRAAVFADALL